MTKGTLAMKVDAAWVERHRRFLPYLTRRQREVIELRYLSGEPRTLLATAEELGISKEAAWAREKGGLLRLAGLAEDVVHWERVYRWRAELAAVHERAQQRQAGSEGRDTFPRMTVEVDGIEYRVESREEWEKFKELMLAP